VPPTVFTAAVEGPTDEAVLSRIAEACGLALGPVHGRRGKPHLWRRIRGYNAAANFSPWIVLVDLDHEAGCAPDLRVARLPTPASLMCFQVAVRAVEAWLLADRDALATYLRVSVRVLPSRPDDLDDPKAALVNAARRSRSKGIRDDIVPRERSGRRTGPLYVARITEFVDSGSWDPLRAQAHSDSLGRCLRSLSSCARRVDNFAT